ncbi:MAG: regulatory protein TetR [Osedax symbiont Rs2]|nr:MAG: regulatory protein TetR [Osedax symbiont Rs2]
MVAKDSERTPELLIKAALNCFLNDEYDKVTTRQIAAEAGVNASMIRYYFGNKEGLFEDMIRQTLSPLLDAMDNPEIDKMDGLTGFFKIYYDTMSQNPKFPVLILKIMALNHGPGKNVLKQLFERGKSTGTNTVSTLKKEHKIDSSIDFDILRISFVSLAMMPMLVKNIFEENIEKEMDSEFLDKLAMFNGQLMMKGLAPSNND